jgi:hypothetical protein
VRQHMALIVKVHYQPHLPFCDTTDGRDTDG